MIVGGSDMFARTSQVLCVSIDSLVWMIHLSHAQVAWCDFSDETLSVDIY
jgi:hypothetical protein